MRHISGVYQWKRHTFFLWPKFFLCPAFFWTKYFFWLKIFTVPKISFILKFCWTKNCSDATFFGPRIFQTQNFFQTKFFFRTQILKKKSFQGQNFCWNFVDAKSIKPFQAEHFRLESFFCSLSPKLTLNECPSSCLSVPVRLSACPTSFSFAWLTPSYLSYCSSNCL